MEKVLPNSCDIDNIEDIEDFENKINDTNIEDLLSYPNPFKTDSSAFYFYTKVMQYNFNEKFSDEFIERTYACLVAWGMDSQKAKLEYFDTFKKSIVDSKAIFQAETSKINSRFLKKFIISTANLHVGTILKNIFQAKNGTAMFQKSLTT